MLSGIQGQESRQVRGCRCCYQTRALGAHMWNWFVVSPGMGTRMRSERCRNMGVSKQS